MEASEPKPINKINEIEEGINRIFLGLSSLEKRLGILSSIEEKNPTPVVTKLDSLVAVLKEIANRLEKCDIELKKL